MINKINFLILFFFVLACKIQESKMYLHREIQYPQSRYIKSLTFKSEPYRYPGTGSDMHWWTWGVDGSTYVIDDDGSNFGESSWYAHLLKTTGIPPHHKVEQINNFQFYDFRKHIPNDFMRRYVCGIVAIDSSLYVSIYDYDWNIPSKSIHSDTLYKRIREYNPWHDLDATLGYNMGFVDAYSRNGGVAGIIASHDFGKTWTNLPNETTPQFFSPQFGAPAFLTFGLGNTDVPAELRPYVYAISNDGSWATGDNVYLGRVHRDSLLFRQAWTFVTNINGKKITWNKDLEKAQPIFTDKDHVGHPTITYNKAINRYILAISSDVYPHYENATREEFKKWNWHSELQLYESENIWGPWSIFYNNNQWGGEHHTCYLLQMPASWISENGLEGTILFAGDYVNRTGEYYGFMTQPYEIELFEKR
jgi:hypothetical protein